MKWLSFLWTLLKALLGISTKPDPVNEARVEAEKKVKAESEAAAYKKALETEHAIQDAGREEDKKNEEKPVRPVRPGDNLFGD